MTPVTIGEEVEKLVPLISVPNAGEGIQAKINDCVFHILRPAVAAALRERDERIAALEELIRAGITSSGLAVGGYFEWQREARAALAGRKS